MARLINCTPHDIHIQIDGHTITVPKTDDVARCVEDRQFVGLLKLDDALVQVNRTRYLELTGLPDAQTNVFYIVSQIAAEAASALGREDVLCVDELVRDSKGRIVACKSLRYP